MGWKKPGQDGGLASHSQGSETTDFLEAKEGQGRGTGAQLPCGWSQCCGSCLGGHRARPLRVRPWFIKAATWVRVD
jgi:hypothetical protein